MTFNGIVIIWYEDGKIHRAILEFIKLTEKHDGKYLAEVTAACVERFGLENMVFLYTPDQLVLFYLH